MKKKNYDVLEDEFSSGAMPSFFDDVPPAASDDDIPLDCLANDGEDAWTESDAIEADWVQELLLHRTPPARAVPAAPAPRESHLLEPAAAPAKAALAEGLEAKALDVFSEAGSETAAVLPSEPSEAAVAAVASGTATNPVAFDVCTAPLTVPTLLEASAGTGKTFSIKHLVLRLVVEEDMPIDTLLIMSFTRAATAELSARIKHHLSDMHGFLTGTLGADEVDRLLVEQLELWKKRRTAALAGSGEKAEKVAAFYERSAIAARIKRSLTRFDKAAIYTIHSFAQKSLTAFAFSSGAALDWTLEDDDAALREDVVEDFLRRELDRYRDAPDVRERLALGAAWSEKLHALAGHPASLMPREIVSELSAETPSENDPMTAVLARFIEEAPAALREKKRAAGVATFDDLLVELWARLEADRSGDFAGSLRSAYRGVLVDEFQDTDPLQFAIFKRLFIDAVHPASTVQAAESAAASDKPSRALFFVGDPKQAIYRFRSADLNTYLDARRLIARIGICAELQKNFRSSPPLVEAFNRFFAAAPADSRGPFLREELRYTQVKASDSNTGLFRLTRGSWKAVVPLEIWGTVTSLPMAKSDRVDATAQAIAGDIAALIGAGKAGKAAVALEEGDASPQIGEVLLGERRVPLRAVEARDIAILVRTRDEIAPIRAALLKYGVRLRMNSKADVCATPEAADLLLVLRAFNAPGDERVVRAARATRFIGEPLSQIAADDEAGRVALRALFENCAAKWRRYGVASAFTGLMEETGLAQRLLRVHNGERMLANYTHLVEVLHEAGRRHPTPAGLIAWFESAVAGADDEAGSEARKLRLESDANVVTGETIHSSKGLQYPIVYVPNAEQFDTSGSPSAVRRARVDAGVSPCGMVLQLSHEKTACPEAEVAEARQELLRLAYVAMTRAAKRLVITVPQRPRSPKNNTLWHGQTLKNAFFRILTGEESPASGEAVLKVLETLSDERTIVLRDINEVRSRKVAPVRALASETAALTAAPAKDRRAQWRISSFTAISRMLEDEAEGAGAKPFFGAKKRRLPSGDILAFPRGAQAGTCLHAMLEEADFAHFAEPDACEAREAFVRRIVERHLSFPSEAAKTDAVRGAARMLCDVLNAEIAPGLRLKNVPAGMRFAELEFLLSMRSALTADILGEALGAIDPKYAVPGLTRERLTGFLTGFIDLVIAVDGKFWVIDWKSNAVADTPEGYDENAMSDEMRKHCYRLQYLIYLVALRRFLKARLGEKFRESMIGGAIYVFLRGVRAETTTAANPQGIVFDPVKPEVIAALDEFFDSGVSARRLAALQTGVPNAAKTEAYAAVNGKESGHA